MIDFIFFDKVEYTKKIYILLVIIIISVGILAYVFSVINKPDNTGEEPGSEINIGNELEKLDLIKISNPRPNQEIESPLLIQGEARGFWFFEASFPVVLTDGNGLIIAQGIATAQGEWMTEDFVRFEAALEFEKPEGNNKGTLILRKDNPSGLPEYDDALEVPVIFK